MSFEDATQDAVQDAEMWSQESVRLNLQTMRKMVVRTSNNEYTPNEFVNDTSTLMLGAARDMARMMAVWGKFATALQKVDLGDPAGGGPGTGQPQGGATETGATETEATQTETTQTED